MHSLAILSPRLFTAHGTALYIEPGSRELRHDKRGDGHGCARVVLEGRHGRIVVYDGPNAFDPIACQTTHCRAIDRTGSQPIDPTMFEIVRLDNGWVALKSGDAYLTALPDGHVTLTQTTCSSWESFILADPVPPQEYNYDTLAASGHTLSISCIETRGRKYIDRAARAVERTAALLRTDIVYWFSNSSFPFSIPGTEIRHIRVAVFADFIEDINNICLRLMPNFVETDFNLIVQDHAFAVNPQAWDPLFLNYDYIGAPFCGLWSGGPYWCGPIIGNGGFSLRSRKLYDALLKEQLTWNIEDWIPYEDRLRLFAYYVTNQKGQKCLGEDIVISIAARKLLETRYGVRFCPPELAGKFSLFEDHPFTNYWLGRSFGFHGEQVAEKYGIVL